MPTSTALKRYCHRVAGVVGQLSASIFGFKNPATLEYAESLGIAFQLTNIIRDVGEMRAATGCTCPPTSSRVSASRPRTSSRGVTVPPSATSCSSSSSARRLYFDAAFAKLAAEDRDTQRAGLIMAAIYRALLEEIRRDRFAVLEQRIALTPLRKLWIAWTTWIRG
jgi:phytoene synthase